MIRLPALPAFCLASLLTSVASAAPDATFDGATSQLTMATVRVDSTTTYSNVVIKLNSFGTLALDDPSVGTQIEYRSTGNRILLPSVAVGTATYNRVSLTGPSFDLVSVGGQVTNTSNGSCNVDAVRSFGVLKSNEQLCLKDLPATASCTEAGAKKYADDYFLGGGYTYTAVYTPTSQCGGTYKVWDLGADLAGAWRKVTPTLINSGLDLNGIGADNTRFYAVASRYVVYSSDGTNWTQATTPSSGVGTLMSLAWSGTAYVAVGSGSTILLSSSGTSWEKITAPSGSTAQLSRVIWANGRFVAVGVSQHILSSTDGRNWTKHAAPTSSNPTGTLVDVAWNGNEFMAVGYDTAGSYAFRSSDGVTWTSRALPAGITVTALGYLGGKWYLGGQSGTGGATKFVMTSTDGVSWSAPQALGTISPVNRFMGNGNRMLAVTGGGLWTSADSGSSWKEIKHSTTQGLSITNGMDLACTSSRCVMIGPLGTVFSTF